MTLWLSARTPTGRPRNKRPVMTGRSACSVPDLLPLTWPVVKLLVLSPPASICLLTSTSQLQPVWWSDNHCGNQVRLQVHSCVSALALQYLPGCCCCSDEVIEMGGKTQTGDVKVLFFSYTCLWSYYTVFFFLSWGLTCSWVNQHACFWRAQWRERSGSSLNLRDLWLTIRPFSAYIPRNMNI